MIELLVVIEAILLLIAAWLIWGTGEKKKGVYLYNVGCQCGWYEVHRIEADADRAQMEHGAQHIRQIVKELAAKEGAVLSSHNEQPKE